MDEKTGRVPVELSGPRRALVMLGAAVMITCVSLSGVGIGINTSAILGRFNATGYFGVVTVLNVLGMAMASALGASLSASFGIRRAALAAGGAIAAMSLFTALTLNTTFLLFSASRFLLSFSTGLITGSMYPIASFLYAPEESGKGYAVFTAAVALGGVLGGALAGLLADRGHMAWSIIYPGLLALLGALPVVVMLPETKGTAGKTDFAGLFLLMATLVLLLFPLNFFQSLGWGHPAVLGSLLGFVPMAALFYRFEMGRENPIMPFRLLKSPGFAGICAIGLFGTGIFTTLQSVYLPVLSQSVLGTTAAVSGLVPMPKTMLTILLPTALAAWMSRRRDRHWILLAAQGVFVLVPSVVLAQSARPGASVWFVAGVVGLVGIAESCKGVAVNNYAQSQLSFADVTRGIPFLGQISTIATAVAGAVFGVILGGWKPGALLSEEVLGVLDGRQAAALNQSGSYAYGSAVVEEIACGLPEGLRGEFEASVAAIRESLGAVIGRMFWVCALCGAVVIVVACTVIRNNRAAR